MGEVRIDKLSAPPVVGQFYSVPTIWSTWCGITRDWPVMGRRHEDAEYLSFPHVHYHVDCRFVSARCFNAVTRYDRRPAGMAFAAQVIHGHQTSIERKRLRCYRASHNYPHRSAVASPQFQNLYSAFAGAQCKRNASGFVCPHKQFPLGSIAPVGGVITCPLHGLRFDATTGICIGAK